MVIEVDVFRVEKPTEETLQHIAHLIAAAFVPESITLPILGGNRALAAPHMYANLKIALEGGEVWVASRKGEGADKALACAMWYPPGKEYMDLKDRVPERAQVDSQLSPESQKWKSEVFFPIYTAIVDRCLGTFEERRDLHYLHILATDPHSQRQGVARQLISHGIARADANGWDTALETCKEENVRFYTSVGMETLGTDTIPSVFGEISMTVLRRRAPSRLR